jgi:uncharacterized lipoprotein YddW (UPF0748 family)
MTTPLKLRKLIVCRLIGGCLLAGPGLLAAGAVTAVSAQPRSEMRAFWVDTFNTALNTHADVLAVVDQAVAANANALFVQVRRRGDSWYLNSLEPLADRTPIAPGFDPLQDVVLEAHARGLAVHAFVIVNAIWNRAPSLFPPVDPNHAFNLHGGYDAATNTIVPGPDSWLTRTLIPDGVAGITLQGHRFDAEFYIDAGHPDAATYTVDVLLHLVRTTTSMACTSIASGIQRSPSRARRPRRARVSGTTLPTSRDSSGTGEFPRARSRRRRTTHSGANGAEIR